MAEQFNPFHHWLGFDENLRQPNHFQLFGVESNLEDPIGFRKQIHTRAKAMLKQLETMSDEEVGERRKLHTKLRRHIVKAHEILLDDKLRAGYLKALRKKAREEKGSAKPLAVPTPQKNSSSDADGQAASQTGSLKGLTMKRAATPTIKGAAAMGEIPMAIPLSKPESPELSNQSTPANDEVSFDNLNSEEIVIRPGRIKRKRSWLIPVLCAIMTLFCIAGIGALVSNFGNQFGTVLGVPEETTEETPKETVPPVINGKVPDDEKPEDPVVPMTKEEIRKATEELVNSKEKAPKLSTEMEPKPKEMKQKSVKDTDKDMGQSLSEPQLHSVRFLFDRARKEMKRGRLESAADQYRMAEAIFEGRKLHADHAFVAAQIKNGRGMIKHLEGFYGQVKHSAKQITGGELEPEPGVFVGFVEGRENDVVVRFGENVAIPYRSLRPGLAVLLASKKSAPNVPAWCMQEAAYRLIHTNGADETKARIDELLVAAEADEYDTAAIRGFRKFESMSAFPQPTMTTVGKEAMSELRDALVGDKYSRIGRLKPNEALQFAKEFSTTAYQDPKMRIAALTESAKLFGRSGNAFQMVDAIDELSVWTQCDSAGRKSIGFKEIADRVSEGADARSAGEAFYEFLSSPDVKTLEPEKLERLQQRMVELVTANGLDDLRRLISQKME